MLPQDIFLYTAGILIVGLAILLFFLMRLRREHFLNTTHLDQQNNLVSDLRQRLSRKKIETDELRQELHDEIVRRAAAEQRIERLRELKTEYNSLWAERTELLHETRELAAELAGLRATMEEEKKHSLEKLTFLDDARTKLGLEFRHVAEKLFAEKTRIFSDQSRAGIESLLQPMRDQLCSFREKVEKTYDLEMRDRISLTQEIRSLKNLNERIGQDALNLTKALRGRNKIQGNWGEMVLEKILEDSGLRPNHDYQTQKSYRNSAGRTLRPDVIIHLPANRDIVIDAKVSLKSYEQSCLAADKQTQTAHLKQHLASLRTHISGLSKKKYEELPEIKSLDFVLLFIPIDGAYIAALQHEPQILNQALDKGVMLTGPSTLLALMRTLHHLWQQSEQNRNARVIARQAGNLYDKFVGFVEAIETIGIRLEQTREAWETARNRLAYGHGNIINKAESLKKLGVRTKKSLPSSLHDYSIPKEADDSSLLSAQD